MTTKNQNYSSIAVANYFIAQSQFGVPNTVLQKLTYCSHGWYLALAKRPLIADEQVEAWERGPVFPKLYRARRGLENDELIPCDDVIDDSNTISNFLTAIANRYKNFSGLQLTALTHAKGTPWDKVAGEYEAEDKALPADLVISNDEIQSHFEALLEDAKRRS